MDTSEVTPSVPQLVPVALEPEETRAPRDVFDYPVRVDHHTVLDMARRLATCLAAVPANTYTLDSIQVAVRAPAGSNWPKPLDDATLVSDALRYLGHEILPPKEGRNDQTAVVLELPVHRDEFDLRVLARIIRAGHHELVTVRSTQRICRWNGFTSWRSRGCLERLEAAGHLVRHPEARRQPTTVWQVASR